MPRRYSVNRLSKASAQSDSPESMNFNYLLRPKKKTTTKNAAYVSLV